MFVALFLLAIAVALVLVGCQATRAGYESAPYRVVRNASKFELRDYPALTVVETPMARSGNGADGSFNRLFRFSTGGNEAKQKIAMTTPVFMSGAESNATMAFVLPAKLVATQVPRPSDGTLTVRELAAGRFAVLRFRGGRSAENEAESLRRLQAWMAAEGLSVKSPPLYAYFDPPWTPAPLRRNGLPGNKRRRQSRIPLIEARVEPSLRNADFRAVATAGGRSRPQSGRRWVVEFRQANPPGSSPCRRQIGNWRFMPVYQSALCSRVVD